MAKAVERKGAHEKFGTHRVLDSKITLPQSSERVDNSLPIYPSEILIEVECLNIDAASFVQMEDETGKNLEKIGAIVMENCRSRGRQINRVTGSGGILIGRVAQIGSKYNGPLKVKVGDRIATLVSLTLTPLSLTEIEKVELPTHRIYARGHAILFETGIAAKLPTDIPEPIAMAAYDVCGAPALAKAMSRKGQNVILIGAGGKAGLLSAFAAREKLGRSGKLIGIEPHDVARRELKSLDICDEVLGIDATDPIAVHHGVSKATRGKMGDVIINVASRPGTEISSIVAANDKSKILFFSMATSFSKATLGAEGIGCPATMIFGNGYYPGHAPYTIGLLRKYAKLRAVFESRYRA